MPGQTQPTPWTVQKYGGTSIGKLLTQITDEIIPTSLQSTRVAIVCSARSGTNKTNGTTSLLLDAIRAATASETDTRELDRTIDLLEEEHLEAALSALRNARGSTNGMALLVELQRCIRDDCDRTRKALHTAWSAGEISAQTQDHVLATGEKLACRIVVAALNSNGIEAEVVLLDNLTLGLASHQQSDIQSWSHIIEAIRERALQVRSRVPVFTGFFGPLPGGLVHSVGRGYSDFCAALCAIALNAQELQIWKEVDGLFTADPAKVPSARLLPTVTAEELAELTHYGSEVVHQQAAEHTNNAGIPLRLKNVKDPSGTGTIVFPSLSSPTIAPDSDFTSDEECAPPGHSEEPAPQALFMAMNGYHGTNQSRRTPTAVTAKDGISVINVRATSRHNPHTFFAQISESLGCHGIEIGLISSSMKSLSLAVSPREGSAAKGWGRDLSAIPVLADFGKAVTVRKHMTIISVVGHRMRNMVGTAAEIFNALARAQVNICLISQGASETNISCVSARGHIARLCGSSAPLT